MSTTLDAAPAPSSRFGYPLLGAVALTQLAGLALTTLRVGTPVGSWLFVHAGWAEPASIAWERAGLAVATLGCVAALLGRGPLMKWAGAALASGWFVLLAVAEWQVAGAPFSNLALAAHATRFAAPLLLAMWRSPELFRWVARAAIALTFAVHGFEAIGLHPAFVDYLLAADQNLLRLGLTQASAETLLRLIGLTDLVLAVVVITGRDVRPVLLWAAFWGVVTAFARMVQGGEGALHQTLIRAANGGVPFVLFLLAHRKAEMSFELHRRTGAIARSVLPLALLLLPLAANAQALSGAAPGHLRLVWTEDPAHRATLSWSTLSSGGAHEVYLDTQPRGGELAQYAQKVAAGSNGAYAGTSTYYHHALLTGLQPATRYYFVVVSNGVASTERYFVTAHDDDRAFRLLFGGDSRSGVTDRRKMNQLMASLAESDPGIVALAHGGDYVATANAWDEWDSWLADHALTFTATGRVLPIIPARGNHEGNGVMFNEVFGFPGGPAVDYYATRLGANATFITLDSETSIGGDQATWLKQQLEAAQAGRWIVPSYHRPAFPAVKEPSGARQFWVPLFEQYDVDVVCESDGHVLKRTVPMRNGKQDPTGVVYVGEGGLGVPQRVPISQWYLQAPGMAKSAHHVQVFSFSADKLVYEARAMGGGVEDRYEFTPRRNGTVVTPEPQPEPVPPEPPALETLGAISGTRLAVTFSTDMDPASGAPGAFTLSGDAKVIDVAATSPRTFTLTTTDLQEGAEYTLTISGVRSAAGGTLETPVTAPFTWTGVPSITQPPVQDDPAMEPISAGGCAAAGGTAAWVGLAAAGTAIWRRRRARS